MSAMFQDRSQGLPNYYLIIERKKEENFVRKLEFNGLLSIACKMHDHLVQYLLNEVFKNLTIQTTLMAI